MPPRNGGGRRNPSATGLNTWTTPRPSRTTNMSIVTDLADYKQGRTDHQAGPYWPTWRCYWSWTAAEASRRSA